LLRLRLCVCRAPKQGTTACPSGSKVRTGTCHAAQRPKPAVVWLQKDYPSYQQLDSLLRGLDWSQSSKPLLKRVSDEMEFLQVSCKSCLQRHYVPGNPMDRVFLVGTVHLGYTGKAMLVWAYLVSRSAGHE